MSRRHRDSEPLHAPKAERTQRHRQERHAARLALGTAEPDDVVDPRLPRSGPEHRALPASRRQRVRHWKTPFWKRRNTTRRQRALAQRREVELDVT
jgi:hypothetical protein